MKISEENIWLNSLFDKETPTQVFSCEIFEIFKNTNFEEHLRKTVFKYVPWKNSSEKLRKIPRLELYWKYFPLNLWEFFRTAILYNTCGRLLLTVTKDKIKISEVTLSTTFFCISWLHILQHSSKDAINFVNQNMFCTSHNTSKNLVTFKIHLAKSIVQYCKQNILIS